MKITLTGSLGHIGLPLTKELIQKGHSVTVISSQAAKQKEIEALGAIAAIGVMEDTGFLTKAFTGADAVYCMVPPPTHATDPDFDTVLHCRQLANNFAEVIRNTGVKRVIHLSSIGAHMDKHSGLILGHYEIEKTLKAIPGIALTHMRPVGFYYNLYAFVPVIKHTGAISSNYGGDDRLPWVSPIDIAVAVADEITTPMITGRKIRYVASDEPTCNEIAAALGAAIGKPDLKWNLISDEQMLSRLESVGLPKKVAAGLTEMNAAIHTGELSEDYFLHRPKLGNVKIGDFAKEFAVIFNQK